jgi:hypothetical protein
VDETVCEDFQMPRRPRTASVIIDESAKQQIMSALSDPYSRRILEATMRKNTTALELSAECDIPIATVYRRLEGLLHTGLIAQLNGYSQKYANWAGLYRCCFKRINITADNGTLLIAITSNERSPKNVIFEKFS